MDDFQTTRSSAAVAETPECDRISVKKEVKLLVLQHQRIIRISAQREDSLVKEVPQMAKSNDNDCSHLVMETMMNTFDNSSSKLHFCWCNFIAYFMFGTNIQIRTGKTVLIVEFQIYSHYV